MTARPRMAVKCDSCGALAVDDHKTYDGLDQHWVGGQHVCDRFEAGIFRATTLTEEQWTELDAWYKRNERHGR